MKLRSWAFDVQINVSYYIMWIQLLVVLLVKTKTHEAVHKHLVQQKSKQRCGTIADRSHNTPGIES